MARYIDADKLIAHLKDEIKGCEPPFGSRANGKSIAYGTKLGLKSAISFAETLATADVVPKSEVEKLHAEAENLRNANADLALALLYECEPTKEHLHVLEATVREKVAREIFEEIEKLIIKPNGMWLWQWDLNKLAELKKKYTEDNNGNSN